MGRTIPKVVSQEEFEKIFKHTLKKKSKKFKNAKKYSLAMLLGFESGMRISEVIGLRKRYSRCCKVPIEVVRIEKDGKKVKICQCTTCKKELDTKEMYRTRTDDWEINGLTKENVDMDQHTIKVVQGKGNKDRVVPLPKRFNNAAYSLLPLKLSRRALQTHITNAGKEVLDKKISFHTFRHGFVTHLLNSGRPIHEVQALAGHSRMDTTGLYSHANPTTAIKGAREVF